MAGELWRARAQCGVETVYGTPVVATRRMYYEDPIFQRSRVGRPHAFATGTRDNVRAFTLGPIVAGATSLKQPLSSDEIIEMLLIGMKGAVTPAAGVWTFTPGNTLDSATFEYYDGAQGWRIAGVYANKLTIAGAVNADNMLDVELFGKTFDTFPTLTPSLAERVPLVFEGWESLLYVDAFGGTPGTTVVPGTLLNWSIVYDNQLQRKYFADNTLEQGAVVTGAIKVDAKLTFEASTAAGLAEFANWDSVTPRLVTVRFGNGNVIGGVTQGTVELAIPGNWTGVDLGKADNGTRVYELTQSYLYSPTLAAGVQVKVTSSRLTAWGA